MPFYGVRRILSFFASALDVLSQSMNGVASDQAESTGQRTSYGQYRQEFFKIVHKESPPSLGNNPDGEQLAYHFVAIRWKKRIQGVSHDSVNTEQRKVHILRLLFAARFSRFVVSRNWDVRQFLKSCKLISLSILSPICQISKLSNFYGIGITIAAFSGTRGRMYER
jgi:hypothetical protein